MGRDQTTPTIGHIDAVAGAGADTGAAAGVDPLVVALGAARTAENRAVFAQLEVLSRIWTAWLPTDLERAEDRRRRRRDVSSWSLHEAEVTADAAVALGTTEAAASRRVQAAVALLVTGRLPLTARLARAGRLAWRQIDTLVVRTRNLEPQDAAAVEEQVLVPAVIGLTIGRFEDAVDRAVISVDPQAAEERRREVRRGRRVAVFKQRNGSEGTDGGATFWAEGPADSLTSVMACLDASAKYWQQQGDTRTREQLRFDLFVTACTNGRLDVPHHLLTQAMAALAPDDGAPAEVTRLAPGPQPDSSQASVPAHVNVTVSLQTLLGLNDEPGTLDRYGPIPAQMARDMSVNGIWRCVVVDDTHGTVLGVGKTTYTHGYVPGVNLRTFLDVAAPVCSVPWCTARAERCDLEHRTPHAAGGSTCSCNVFPTCRRHHRLKTAGGMTARTSPDEDDPLGTEIWTTAGGQDVVHRPHAPLPPEAYRITRPRPPAPEPEPDEPQDDTPPF